MEKLATSRAESGEPVFASQKGQSLTSESAEVRFLGYTTPKLKADEGFSPSPKPSIDAGRPCSITGNKDRDSGRLWLKSSLNVQDDGLERKFTLNGLIPCFALGARGFPDIQIGDSIVVNINGYKTVSENGQKSELVNPTEYIKQILPKLSKARIEELTTVVRKHYMGRFKKHRNPKYGTLNKGFTEQQLIVFLRAIEEPKFKLLFEFQANLGLRIGEAVKVNMHDIDFETRELKIHTEKAKTLDALIIPINLFQELIGYVRNHKNEIELAKGYLFYKDASKDHYHRAEPYLAPEYVRTRFTEYVRIAGLDEVYDISEESSATKRPRELHRLTTHSLRHYAITRFAKNTNGNLILTSRFARHSDPETTMVYISRDKKQLYEAIDSVSVSDINLMKKRLGR